MDVKTKKVLCIEGLRTIGWIGVFICHFKGAFLPNTVWWTDNTPLEFIYSGNAYVRLFFVISGFVIAYKFFTKECYDSVLPDIIKRYFRLMPPILVAEITVYFFMKANVLKNYEVSLLTGSEDFLGAFNRFTPDILGCLKEALFGTYFHVSSGYIATLWTMVYEYLGSVLILAAIYILRKNDWRWLFYIVFLIAFSSYYNYFVIGMMLADIVVNTDTVEIVRRKKAFHVGIILIGYYMLSMIEINDSDKFTRVIFGIGICIFMIGVISSPIMERILGNKIMIYGGKISYSAYIVHWPIIEIASCNAFLFLYNKIGNESLLKTIIFLGSLIITFVVASFYSLFIEPIGLKTIAKLWKKN